jgi:CubicO group peptidase (beta-lactamase class C family)
MKRASIFSIVYQVILVLLLVSGVPSWAQMNFSELEQVALAEMKEKGIPGSALAIVKGDKVIYARGFGLANVETGEAVRPEMLFRLGSTTKMFTCLGLLQLVEAGKVKLNAPVSQYVRSLHPKLGSLTPHRLMSHTAGLRDEAIMFGPHDETALGAKLRLMNEDAFFTEPGKVYSYSNPGYWLTGLVIEEVSGKFFADSQADTIFGPLGMQRTTFRPTVAITYPLALGHESVGKGQARIVRPFADNASGWPAGSMFSSVLDLSRFVIAFLNEGKLEGREVMSPSIIREMVVPHATIPGGGAYYGYGLNITLENGVGLVQHAGSRSGYGSLMRMVPDQKIGVINLANLTGTSMPKTCAKALELFVPELGKSEKPPRQALAMAADEMSQYAGVYVHGADREELLVKSGKLWFKRGTAEVPVRKLDKLRFATQPANGGTPLEFVLVKGSSGEVEYMYRGGRTAERKRSK